MPARKVVFPFSGFDIGGSHVATFELAQGLRRDHGADCTFLVAARSNIAEEARRLGFAVTDNGEEDIAKASWQARRSVSYALKRLPARWALVRRLDRDAILHCNELTGIQAYGVLARPLGFKVVYHHHALNRMIPPNTTLVRTVNASIAISEICRRALDFLPARTVHTVLNPIEVTGGHREAARARIVTKCGLDPDDRLVGFVANFWKRKRPDFFLEAFAALRRMRPDAKAIVFGRDADYRLADLQAMAARFGVGDAVVFAGFLMPAEDNVAALDLLVAPALDEPFGRTPIEAALVGTPYLATDDAGHGEIGRRWGGGRLAARDASAEVFARQAAEILDDPSAVVLSEAARSGVAAEFSVASHAAAVEGIYATL